MTRRSKNTQDDDGTRYDDNVRLNYVQPPHFYKLPDVMEDAILKACKGSHINPNLMARICWRECGGNLHAVRSNGVAGPFQFSVDTARKYHLSPQDRFDPYKSARAAVALMEDSYEEAKKFLKREPTQAELYVMHIHGSGGGPAILQNPDKDAVGVLRRFYNESRARSAIKHNGGVVGDKCGGYLGRWERIFGGISMHAKPGPRQGHNEAFSGPDDDEPRPDASRNEDPRAEREEDLPQKESRPDRRHKGVRLSVEHVQPEKEEKEEKKEKRGKGQKGKPEFADPDSPVGTTKNRDRHTRTAPSGDPPASPSSPPPAPEEEGGVRRVFRAVTSFFSPPPDDTPESVDTSALQQSARRMQHDPHPRSPGNSPKAPAERPRPASRPSTTHPWGFGDK